MAPMKKLLSLLMIVLLAGCVKEKTVVPVTYTLGANNVTLNTAQVAGSFTGINILEKGVCWSTESNPEITNNKIKATNSGGGFTITLTGLDTNTTYFARAFATNEAGTSYGDNVTFTTLRMPTLNTNTVVSFAQTTATLFTTYTPANNFSVVERGLCWSTNPAPTTGNNKQIFTGGLGTQSLIHYLSNLNPNTTYYARAYASTSVATAYGNEVMFKTLKAIETGTVSDYMGNVYKTVKIGDQEWMAENLKTLYFNDGSGIPIINSTSAWANLTIGGCCSYLNSSGNQSTYGMLYNYYAVTDPRGIAPVGWHVPTSQDWEDLFNYINNTADAGSKLKAVNTLWYSGTCASNTFSFSAIPGGYRDYSGYDAYVGQYANFWSSSSSSGAGYMISMYYYSCNVDKLYQFYRNGYSVRCVKD
jgi:uncharacterized protein (TIGR02145 family)